MHTQFVTVNLKKKPANTESKMASQSESRAHITEPLRQNLML